MKLNLINTAIALIDEMNKKPLIVDKKAEAVKSIIASVEKKLVLTDDQKKRLNNILNTATLPVDESKKDETVDGEKISRVDLDYLKLTLERADVKPAKKKIEEFDSKVSFETGVIDFVYLKKMLLAKKVYLSKQSKQ